MKQLYKNINGIWGILLIIYTLCVIYLEALVDENYLSSFGKLVLPAAVIAFFYFVIPKIRKLEFDLDGDLSAKAKRKFFFAFFAISLLWLSFWLAGAFPGSFSPDSFTQYAQVVTGDYSDWHPVLQTLIAIKLPLMLFGNKVSAIIPVQIIEFSLAVSYAAITMLTYSRKKWFVYATFVFMVFNPVTTIIIMYPWKDCTFAISVLMCVSFGVHIYATNGGWLKKIANAAALALMLCIAEYSRHNSVLFTIPFLIAVLFISGALKTNWVSKVKLVALFAAMCIFVSGVLYPLLNVSAPGNRQSEMMGLPMSIIGNVVKENPETLDEETKEFVYSVASPEKWSNFKPHSGWNSVKFTADSIETIDSTSALKILKITLKCFISAPEAALEGLLALTNMVWAISSENCYWALQGNSISENDYGISYQGISFISNIQQIINQYLIKSWFAYPCYHIGFMMLLLLIVMVAKFNSLRDFKKLLMCVPLFAYNYGTMLLLSGIDFRFFYYTFLITPILIFLLLLKRDERESKKMKSLNSKLKFLFPAG